MKAKLTKSYVEGLPFSAKQVIHWDAELPGFGVLVGPSAKSYVVQKNIRGKAKRCTIGKHGLYTPDTARTEARELLLSMSKGVNPTEVKAKEKIRGINLQDLFSKYKRDRAQKSAKGTFVNYQDFMDNQFGDWKLLPIAEITKDMVIARHRFVTEESGPYAANSSLQFLRALFNYAQIDDDDLKNPVDVMSQKKLWHETKRRKGVIRNNQMPDWYSAVLNVHNEALKDALRFLVFTGLRRMEAFTLQWKNVDFENKTFLIPHTKNGTPLELPMSTFVALCWLLEM